MIRLGSVAAALTFYFERMDAGDARALPTEPKEDVHGKWSPDPGRFHDVGLLVGFIGRLLRTRPWVDGEGVRHRPLLSDDGYRLIKRVYQYAGQGDANLGRNETSTLDDIEGRLARPMIRAGVIASDQFLDGWAELREFAGAGSRTLRRLVDKYPLRNFGGRRFQTLRRWVEDWVPTLPRQYRRNWFALGRLEPGAG